MTKRTCLALVCAGLIVGLLVGACGGGDDPEPGCGNDRLEGTEQCDMTRLGGATCQSLGFEGGTLACRTDCTFNTGACTGDPCGNGNIDAEEDCDGENLNGQTCAGLGYTGGELACDLWCFLDTTACEGEPCGNGALNPGEDCDGAQLGIETCLTLGYTGGQIACTEYCFYDTSACTGDPCGNGQIDPGEPCDGAALDGETCESRGYTGGTLSCFPDCRFNESGCEGASPCGDGQLDPGEECDGAQLGGQTCQALGYTGGTLACDSYCDLDASGCSGCTDDANEPNDDQAGATALTAGAALDATLCNEAGGETDWFSLSVAAGETVALEVSMDQVVLDLDVDLLDAQGVVLDSSASMGGREVVSMTATDAATVYLRVFPYSDRLGVQQYRALAVRSPACVADGDCPAGQVCDEFACEVYVCDELHPCAGGLVCNAGTCVECLTVEDCPDPVAYRCEANTCVLDCSEDRFEPNSSEETAATLVLPADEAGLTLCGEFDSDFFALTLLEGHLYSFGATFTAADGNVELTLYDPVGEWVAWSDGSGDTEEIRHAIATGQGGAYLLEVQLYDLDAMTQTYALTATDEGTPECVESADCQGGQVCVEYVCVAPAAGDTCAAPIAVGSFPYTSPEVDLAQYGNDLDFAEGESCTEYAVAGQDVIYQLSLAAGQALSAELTCTFDGALYLLSACGASPLPGTACVAGADLGLVGDPETLTYTPNAAGTFFLVVDAYSSSSGTYQLDLAVQAP